MERYVDGYLIPVPKDKIEQYKRIARKAGEIWKEHGALEYYECLGDDLEVKDMGKSFRDAAGCKENETVVFSWIVFESRQQRDKVNAEIMKDQRIQEMMQKEMEPFDYRRMTYGGFMPFVMMPETAIVKV